jgi:hypothetical protein
VTATELLADLARQGFTLAAEGDRVRVRPANRLTDALRQVIREHRDQLLSLLAAGGTWDQTEADRLVAAALLVWARPDRPRGLDKMADAIDAAWLARDLPRLRQTVADFLATLDAVVGRGAPSVPQPPPGAHLYFQDEHGRPTDASNACLWTWSRAPRWFCAAQHPPPSRQLARCGDA